VRNKENVYKKWIYPSTIILFIITVIPTIFLFGISLFNYELGRPLSSATFAGFSNYLETFGDQQFWHSLLVTAEYVIISVGVEMVLGFLIAYFLYNRNTRLRDLLLVFMIIPMTITPSIAGLVWRLNFHPIYGMVNQFLGMAFGIAPDWYSYNLALWSLIIVDIWQWTPFISLISLAGLLSIDDSIIESAKVEGANRFQLIRHIFIPLIKPVLLIGFMMRLMDNLKMFDVPFSLTEGGPGNATELLSMHIYRIGFFHTGNIGLAASVAVILLIIMIFLATRMANLIKQS
jgi:multiple sugar transport system permease protein